MKNTASRLLACLAVAAIAPSPESTVAAQQLTAAERAATVASVWAEARYNFAYWDRVRADWDSGLVANLKLAAEPQSDLLFYRRLRRLVALLGDGRAAVIAPPTLRSRIARPPLLVSSVERRPFILDYAENDEMRVARPPRLSEILAVQGVPAETWIRDSVLPEVCAATPADRWQRAAAWMLQGDKGTTLHLLIRVPGGEPRGLSVTRSLSLNDRWPLDPPAFATESLPGGIAVVRIASLGDEEVVRQFDRAFPDFSRVQGLVLDLRRATDGKTEYANQILARLTDRPFSAVRWRTPQYRAVFRAWNLGDSATTWYGPEAETVAPNADRPSYGGPIAALVSSATAGPAEDLLAAFRAAGRGLIIGEPTGGSPGDVATFALPKSWGVQFSVTRHEAPDGTGFAGVGVKPHLVVIRTVNDLLAGNEPALEKAREYLKGGLPPP
ncbi:MAG TPA: S41 family peptidase [Gemmatimonadales bacterium]|nr:S41 family peptidase [Gemmatimonadales bacterium]